MHKSSYAVGQLAQTLRDARLARGLTQRELSHGAGITQSRLALIEAGEVDLRTSTLVQLARALDLELVLTPRRVLPAVQSLIRTPTKRWQEHDRHSVRGTPIRVLRHIQQRIAALERIHPSSDELARAKRAAQALHEVAPTLGPAALQPLRRAVHWLGLARTSQAQSEQYLAKAAAQLRELHQTLPAVTRLERASETQTAAYSLEDEVS